MFWAISGLVLVGLSWTLVGIVLGNAPKKGIPPEVMIFFGAAVPTIVGLIVLHIGILGTVDWSSKAAFWGIFYYGLSAFFNFLMMHLLSLTMQKGPNGIVWSITQSGMVITFLCGVIFKGDIVTWVRIAGILVLLAALLLLGLARNNDTTNNSRAWVWMAFGCFLLCGINQTCAMLATYVPEVRDDFNGVARSVVLNGGAMIPALCWNIASKRGEFLNQLSGCIRNKYLWIYVAIQQGFGLIAAYFIQFRCFDYLSAHNLGSAAYPILVASCLLGFAFYSTFGLREKSSLIQKAGMALCILGIVLICMK
jgi:drug/metabolite transporter (DMT)-like permease